MRQVECGGNTGAFEIPAIAHFGYSLVGRLTVVHLRRLVRLRTRVVPRCWRNPWEPRAQHHRSAERYSFDLALLRCTCRRAGDRKKSEVAQSFKFERRD